MSGFLKSGLLATLLALSMVPLAAAGDDLLPWPWGSECPFPWTKIEGTWVARGKSPLRAERFSFTVKGTLETGARVIEVRRFDEDGVLIGLGEGVSQKGERIVRAAMAGTNYEKGNSYWALVRTYNEAAKKSCSRAKQVTVITLRPVGGTADEDVHVIVDKEDASSRAQP